MSNGFLSQEEINSLINGELDSFEESNENSNNDGLEDIEKDLLGEVANISMGSAATALYQLVNEKVNITTPVVEVTTFKKIQEEFTTPCIVLDVEYTSGIDGRNVFIIKRGDAAVIANLMMGGNGIDVNEQLTEIEISAVQESMNQMVGSSATSLATMLMREVNISPPKSNVWEKQDEVSAADIANDDPVVRISFKLEIGNILTSSMMQVLSYDTAKKIVSIMMGEEQQEIVEKEIETVDSSKINEQNQINTNINNQNTEAVVQQQVQQSVAHNPTNMNTYQQPVNVQRAEFTPLSSRGNAEGYNNIDLILDVPLQVSVVLGRTKKTIKDILSLGNGSLIELDKLTDEPVEVLVNNKTIATGEVVVIDENFGIRITNIVSGADRVKSLKDN